MVEVNTPYSYKYLSKPWLGLPRYMYVQIPSLNNNPTFPFSYLSTAASATLQVLWQAMEKIVGGLELLLSTTRREESSPRLILLARTPSIHLGQQPRHKDT